MARDKEIELIESTNNEYDINTYTIQYDSKAKRFFKGFAPKVVNGGLLSTVLFAGLGVATLVTGGIAGVGIGAIAGASAAVGTTLQAAYSGINYGRNASRARFKALGIGGKEDDVGTIGVIKECESQAYKYTQLLEDYPSQKKFTLDDGAIYSRHDLKKRIKENEDIAYHGLKYILDQGMYISEQLNALKKKNNLTEKEENKREKFWDIMDRIAECVKDVTSKRTNFNPYKNLIIDYIQQGCLIGNYDQNNQIRAVATNNDKEMATKLYSNMYEQPLLESIKAERAEIFSLQQQINNDNVKLIRTRKELIQHDSNIQKISTENKKLASEIKKLSVYYILIEHAKGIYKAMPDQLVAEKTMLINSINGLKIAVESNNKEVMRANESSLSQLVDDISKKLITISANQKVKEQTQKQINAYKNVLLNQKAQINKLEDAIEIAQDVAYETNQELDRANTKYANSVKRNLNKRLENKYLRKRVEDAENTVDALYQDLNDAEKELDITTQGRFEAEQRVEKQTKKYENAVKHNLRKRAENKTLKQQNDQLQNDFEIAATNAYETEQQLNQTKKENAKIKTKKNKATRLISNLIEDNKSTNKRNDKLQSDNEELIKSNTRLQQSNNYAGLFLDEYMDQNDELTAQNKYLLQRAEDAENTVDAIYTNLKNESAIREKIEKENKGLKAYKKSAAGKLTRASQKDRENKAKIKAQKEQIDTLNDDITNYVNAQNENINKIIDLKTDKEVLQEKLEGETKRAKANEDLAINLAYSERKMKKQLDELASDRDAYKQGVKDLEDEKSRLEQQLEEETYRADMLQAKEDQKQYNFVRGGLVRRFNNLIDKVDAHLEYTKEMQEDTYDKQAVSELDHYVATLRSKDLNSLSMDDINTYTKLLKTVYKVHKNNLEPISNEKLKEVKKEMHTLYISNDSNLNK